MIDRTSGPARERRGPPGVPAPVLMAIWTAFLIIPIVNAVTRSGQTTAAHWLVVAAAVAFSGTYLGWGILGWEAGGRAAAIGISAMQVPIAIALTVFDQSGWGYLFCYSAACLAVTMPTRLRFPAVLACAAICFGSVAAGDGDVTTGLSLALSTAGVGALMTMIRTLHDRNGELREARAALANVAVAAERERFARDLHDLLGHSLSVIAIKAELAGRLLPTSPDRAASEVADLETVARQALGEVRDAVSGYRQPTLAGELEGARVALTAAGIEASFAGDPVSLEPAVEAVLAWTVREGATNVIRHSRATRCSVIVRSGVDDAGVEVVDDGVGDGVELRADAGLHDGDGEVAVARAVAANGSGIGNGLAGLRERAASLRGRIEAGAAPGGGYRLAVSVPVGTAVGGGDQR
ncbi:MAG TPA: histidine kinase [Solirubrobacteraceae bacterium]|nr:histidine kinase [Solirubrobacteraceae bacterium]